MYNIYTCISLSTHFQIYLLSHSVLQVRQININAFGDDYVSFTVMHITFSPDHKYILISTGMNAH